MNLPLKILLLSLFLPLLAMSGCNTLGKTMTRVNAEYMGRNMDEFVLKHGVPQSKYQLNNGDYLYTWNSGTHSYAMPATVNTYGHTAYVSGGGSIDIYCELQIHTDSKGTILDIKAMKDTVGEWDVSRCGEVFRSK